MFGKKKLTGALSFAASTALALACATPALAEVAIVNTGVTAPIQKTVNANSSVDIKGETFTFTATAYGTVDKDGAIDTTDTSAINSPSIETTISAVSNITGTGTTSTKDGAVPLTGLDFDHAGVYAYKVVEKAGSNRDVTYAKEEYVMYVYVDNMRDAAGADTGLQITDVKFVQTKSAAGADIAITKDSEKVAKPNFTNTFVPTSDLKLSKEVTGTYGDKTKEFAISVTITVPGNATEPADGYTYTVTKRDGTTTTTGKIKSGTAVDFTLADGETVLFDDLPEGTTYVVAETGAANYTATAAVAATDIDKQAISGSASGTKGAGLTATDFAEASSAAVVGPTDNANTTVVTNDYTPVTPTGILVSNLPYILLIGIPVASLAAWLVIRGKRYSQAA